MYRSNSLPFSFATRRNSSGRIYGVNLQRRGGLGVQKVVVYRIIDEEVG